MALEVSRENSIVEIRIFRIVIDVNIVIVGFVDRWLVGGRVWVRVVGIGCGSLVIRSGTANDGLAHASDPIILFCFRVGVEEVRSFGGGYFETVSFAGFQIGGFDRGTGSQVHKSVRGGVFVFGEEKLTAFEDKVPATPFLEKRGRS
jgi:hypothetical protein